MPAEPKRWPTLHPVVADLHMITRHDAGLYDETHLREQRFLLDHPAVRDRWARNPGAPAYDAVEEAVADVRRYSGRALSEAEHDALALLLGITAAKRCNGRRARHGDRATEALETLGGPALDVDNWRRRSTSTGGSEETDLLGRFVLALDRLQAPPSATRTLRRTPPLATGEAPADVQDLHGTWLGTTQSHRIDKDPEADGTARTFMVVDAGGCEPSIRWFYRHGWAWAVSVRPVQVGPVRRLVVVFEADVSFEQRKPEPWHRGACLLDTDGRTVAGPYWNDRRAFGTLTFADRLSDTHLAADWDDADRLDLGRRG